ncbi:MAG: hypothetical protein JW955_06120 [Sedimentisphaerales bacterium]|nr:hypothetical protein [Sedimentisphaerales bacterium]
MKKIASIVLLAILGASMAQAGAARTGITLWDTAAPFGDAVDLAHRGSWKAAPTDLLTLEADPLKASSDPGYYGREYTFNGDAVVENDCLIAAFWASRGRAIICLKADGNSKAIDLTPLQAKKQPMRIRRYEVVRNAGDEVALDVVFSTGAGQDACVLFVFDKTSIVEIKPAENMRGISVAGSIAYGVAPSFVGDDLILAPGQFSSTETLHVPAGNVFLGLLQGENSEMVMTWPPGKQQMRLNLGDNEHGTRIIESIDFDNDGQSVYVAVLEAPGIWHREELKPSYLEKDVTLAWKRPFPAEWVTQLDEGGVKADFAFRQAKGQIWRAVAGMYIYPIWFDGDNTCYHLSKKVVPKGESIIYFLEGKDTPPSTSTPVEIMKATLGRQVCDMILDRAGRKLRTHHRRAGEGIRRACTCGCTDAIQAVCDAGQEVEKAQYVVGAVDDMVYFVVRHMARIEEYRRFADDMIKFLRATGDSSPDLKPYLDRLEQIAQQIPQEYAVQKENIKSLEYADELARKTKALTARKDPPNLPAYKVLGEKWRAMGGAQDGLLGQYHVIARKLHQEAGYGCLNQPGAVEVAKEVRKRCRQCLRNPDGYEIWPSY